MKVESKVENKDVQEELQELESKVGAASSKSETAVGGDSSPDIDFSLDTEGKAIDETQTELPPMAEVLEEEGDVKMPDVMGALPVAEIVVENQSLEEKKERLRDLRKVARGYAHNKDQQAVVLEQISHALKEVAAEEESLYEKATDGNDLGRDVEKRVRAERLKLKERGKPALTEEEYRKGMLLKAEKDIRAEDRENAEELLKVSLKKRLPGYSEAQRAKMFDEKGEILPRQFDKYFAYKVSESGLSEASFCRMLSMGYRIDLLKEHEGVWEKLKNFGASATLPVEGGTAIYYHTKGGLDELKDFAVEQVEEIENEAKRRASISFENDGQERTKVDIEAEFIQEEIELAKSKYYKALTPSEQARFVGGEGFQNHLDRRRIALGLSEPAFYMMINMGYNIHENHPKSFCHWIELKSAEEITQEVVARKKVIDRFKPHQENNELLATKVRKALLKKYAIE